MLYISRVIGYILAKLDLHFTKWLKTNIGCASNPTARSVTARFDNNMIAGECKVVVLQIATKTKAFERIATRLRGTLKTQTKRLNKGILLGLLSLESFVNCCFMLVFTASMSHLSFGVQFKTNERHRACG